MLEVGQALALSAKVKLVMRDRWTAWETDLKANIDVSEENEALLLQTDLHLNVEIWAETTLFLYFLLQGSEDIIPVKLALKAEKTKVQQVNFLGCDLPIQDFTLWAEILLVYINQQSCSLNTSHPQELSSYTELPEWGSESTVSEQPVHPGDSDNFPHLSGFGWQSCVSHQSIPFGGWWTRSHLHLVAGTPLSALTAAEPPATARAKPKPLCSAEGRCLQDSPEGSACPKARKSVWLHGQKADISICLIFLVMLLLSKSQKAMSEEFGTLDGRMKHHTGDSNSPQPRQFALGSLLGGTRYLTSCPGEFIACRWRNSLPTCLPWPGKEWAQGQIKKFGLAGQGSTNHCVATWECSVLWSA